MSQQQAMIEIALFAPYNEAAALIGSFSDWQEVPMRKGEDGHFRASVALADGDYQYKFRVQSKSWFLPENKWVDVTDPYATDVDDATQNAVLRVRGGRRVVDEYVWRHDDKPLPPDHELVIYEMHVGDFSGGEADPFTRGKFSDVIAKLDYLTELGVNAIELMPVKEFPGDQGWGYNPRYFFAVESSYGTTEDLKRLVDECHARGIRVLIDGVYNHAEASAPLAQIDHDYWFHHEPKDAEHNWGPEFNYGHYDAKHDVKPAWKFIGDTVRYWIEEYHIDGIRYDAARQIGDFEFMRWVVGESKRAAGAKPFYNVAEYMPPDPAITGVDGPMDGCWHDFFLHGVIGALGDEVNFEGLKDVLDPKRKGFMGATDVVNYIANHDHDRLFTKLGAEGVVGDEAFRRARLGAAMLMTAVGLPMIWMGEEFGEYKAKTPEQNKIDWGLMGSEPNRGLFAYYKGLIALRKQHPALHTANISFIHESPNNCVLAFARWDDAGDQVIVVMNLSGRYLKGYTVPNIPEDGAWREWTRGYDVEARGGQITLDLPEREAQVLVKG
jgi:1,4-alpha-glucan branching enzyme